MSPALRAPNPHPLRVGWIPWDQNVILRVEGRLDQTFDGALARVMDELRGQNRIRVVVDLAKLEYLNSRGVSIFVAAVDALREAGGDLKIAAAPEQAQLVLKRLGIDRFVQVLPTVEEALKAFEVPIHECLSGGELDVFVSSARGKAFHASSCPKVRRIATAKIHASKKAARDAGLKPCAACVRD